MLSRIVLPMTVEEYHIGHMYTVIRMSRLESHGDAGVEVLKSEKFENEAMGKGMYTKKLYHLGSKMPGWVNALLPKGALILEEESWNSYPNLKTMLVLPYLGDRLRFSIESKHADDAGTQANIHNLAAAVLKKREIDLIDVMFDVHKEIVEGAEPRHRKIESCGRGPFAKDWMKGKGPLMCCYKLVTAEGRVLD